MCTQATTHKNNATVKNDLKINAKRKFKVEKRKKFVVQLFILC